MNFSDLFLVQCSFELFFNSFNFKILINLKSDKKGLSLLSDSIMRFRHVESDEIFDVHLPRYSLYLMLDDYRYDWTHEILNEEESKNTSGSMPEKEGKDDDGMEETVAAFQYYFEGVGIMAIGSIGVVINIVALYILFKKQVSFFFTPKLDFFICTYF